MSETNGNEVLESAKGSISCELRHAIIELIDENPDHDYDTTFGFVQDRIDYDGRLTEIVDTSVPIYNHEIMACASVDDIWTREPELGPVFGGEPTLINITAGLIYEYLSEYAYEILDELINEIIERDNDSDMTCDQCTAAMINGVYCHETGCPNTDKEKIDGDWVTPESDDE